MANEKQNVSVTTIALSGKPLEGDIEQLLHTVSQQALTPPSVRKKYEGVVPPKLIEEAYENIILGDIPRFDFRREEHTHEEVNSTIASNFEKYRKAFFETHFLLLVELKIAPETSRKVGMEIITASKRTDFQKSTIAIFNAWLGVRKAFDYVHYLSSKNVLEAKHLTALQTFCSAFASLQDLSARRKLAFVYGEACKVNQQLGLLDMPAVLNPREVKEVLLACPVLFSAESRSDDGFSDAIVDMLKLNEEQAVFLSLFNDLAYPRVNATHMSIGLRPVTQLPKHETFPQDITLKLELLRKGQNNDDSGPGNFQAFVATPYVDYRLREIADPYWSRIVPYDPYAFVALWDVPYMVMIKRWSGMGILPSINELLATTVYTLQESKAYLLKRLTEPAFVVEKQEGSPEYRFPASFLMKLKMSLVRQKFAATRIMRVGGLKTGSAVPIPVDRVEKTIDRILTLFKEKKVSEFMR